MSGWKFAILRLSYIYRYLRYLIFYIQNLNVEYRTSKKKYWLLSFYRFFENRFLISQLIRIHILFHIQIGPSVDITPHGDPRRGVFDFFFIRRLGPSIYVHQKKCIRDFKHSKKTFAILATPQNILILYFDLKKRP